MRFKTFLGTIPYLSKAWYVSADIKPNGIVGKWGNILHFTVNNGTHEEKPGHRMPAVWIREDNTLRFSSMINDHISSNFHTDQQLTPDIYTKITIIQRCENGEYIFNTYIGENKTHERVNNNPLNFKNVNIYTGGINTNPANAMIKNIVYFNLERCN